MSLYTDFISSLSLYRNAFNRATKPVRHKVATVTSTMFGLADLPSYSKNDFENIVKEGYTRNELVFACIDRTAKTAASVKLLLKNRRSGKVIDHGELRDLLDRPNELMTEFTFWWLTITMLLLAGHAYWQKVRDKNTGKIIALWPMRPDWVFARPGKTKFIDGFDYGPDEQHRVYLAYADVLSFQFFDPRNLYKSISPTAIACRTIDTDNSITDLIKLFMERGGIPNGLLSSKLKLDDDDVTDIRRRWTERYGGWEGTLGAPAVLDMDSTYQQLQMSFKDMDFEKLDSRNETRICMIYDIDPIIVGTSFGLARSTFNNIGEAEGKWWRNSLKPRYKMLADELLLDLVTEIDSSLTCIFDYSEVSVLQEDRKSKFDRANSAVTAGWFTMNMARDETGLELLPPEQGDVFLWTTGTTPIHIDQLAEKLLQVAESSNGTTSNTTGADSAIPQDDSAPKQLSLPMNNEPIAQLVNSVLTESKTEKEIVGTPLDHDSSVAVPAFSQDEIDSLFDAWGSLPKKP